MRILVVSDTHGKLDRFMRVFEKLKKESPVDLIIHCGDYYEDAMSISRRCGIRVAAVKGNCDGYFDDCSYCIVETEAGNFLVCHGHMEGVSHDLQRLYYKVLESGCIGAFFGHTHRSAYVDIEGIYLMNPGSLTSPRDGSGGTFGLMETGSDTVFGKICRYDDFIGSDSSGGRGSKSGVTGGRLRSLLNYSDRF